MSYSMAWIVRAWVLMTAAVLLAACGSEPDHSEKGEGDYADSGRVSPVFCDTPPPYAPGNRNNQNARNDDSQPIDPAVLLANTSPSADAGDNVGAVPGEVVTLDGSGSGDQETAALQYTWQQVSGPGVVLSNTTVARPTFTLPFLFTQDATLTFRLTVADEAGGTARDTTHVHVTVSGAQSREGGRVSQTLRDHVRLPYYVDGNGKAVDLDGEVTDPLISADGRIVLGRSVDDSAVRIWSADTGKLMHVLSHEDRVGEAVLSADGRVVLTRSIGGYLDAARLWSTDTGELLHSWKMLPYGDSNIMDVALSADGHIALAHGARENAGLWDTATGERLHVLESDYDYDHGTSHLALSADAKRALTWSEGEVLFWDVATGTELGRLPGDAHALSADGGLAMSGRAGGHSLRIIDTATGNELCALHGDEGISAQALLSTNGRTVLAGRSDGTVQFWDVASCGEPRVLGQHQGTIRTMALSDDGLHALTGGEDGTARLWNTQTGGELHVLHGHEGVVHGAALSADGRFVVTTGEDKTIRLWNAKTGEQLRVLDDDLGKVTVESVALSTDGRLAFTGGGEFTAHVWDADTGSRLGAVSGQGNAFYWDITTVQVALSGDGNRGLTGLSRLAPEIGHGAIDLWGSHTHRRLGHGLSDYFDIWSMALNATGTKALLGNGNGSTMLADVSTGDLLRCFHGYHDVPVVDVAFDADEHLVLMGSTDGMMRLWDAESGDLLQTMHRHETQLSSVALSADGRFALAGGGRDQMVRLWNAQTGEELHALAHANSVTDVALSADGSLALTADSNGMAWLWDWNAPEGDQLYALRGHEKRITSVALGTDGTIALTGSRDGTARLWEITVDR